MTNEEVCLRHTRYLFQSLSGVHCHLIRPEICLIRTTALRLNSLLSSSGQESIKQDFPLQTHILRHSHTLSFDENESIVDDLFQENERTTTPVEYISMVSICYY